MKTRDYNSVSEAMNDILDDGAFKKSVTDQMRLRRVVKTLSAIRAVSGVTQAEVAAILGCKQGKISKIERGMDSELKMSEVEAYAKATKTEITILISDRGKSLADQIKHHAFSIKQAFLKLAELAHKDSDIAQGVAELHVQAFHNLNSFLAETAEKLPPCPDNGMPYIQMVATSSKELAIDDTDCDEPTVEREYAIV